MVGRKERREIDEDYIRITGKRTRVSHDVVGNNGVQVIKSDEDIMDDDIVRKAMGHRKNRRSEKMAKQRKSTI